MLNYAIWVDHGEGPIQNPDITQEQFDAGLIQLQQDNINNLKTSMTTYHKQFVSETELMFITVGASKGLPKCTAVFEWLLHIYTQYNMRIAKVTYVWDQALHDFSNCGNMPYSLKELIIEVTTSLIPTKS